MRADTIFRFTFSYDFVAPSAVVEESEVNPNHSGKGRLITGGSGMQLMTQQPLAIGGQVSNLRDTRGVELLITSGKATPMYVHESVAQLNPFGEVVGWKQTLRRTPPRNLGDILDDIGNWDL